MNNMITTIGAENAVLGIRHYWENGNRYEGDAVKYFHGCTVQTNSKKTVESLTVTYSESNVAVAKLGIVAITGERIEREFSVNSVRIMDNEGFYTDDLSEENEAVIEFDISNENSKKNRPYSDSKLYFVCYPFPVVECIYGGADEFNRRYSFGCVCK